jgi:hypothetical protein
MKKVGAAFATIGLVLPPPLLAEVDQKTHDKCSMVADYAGCVKVNQASSQKESKEDCWSDQEGKGYCLSGKGLDMLGLPKILGTLYRISRGGLIFYYEADAEATKAKDKPEFVAYRVERRDEEPRYLAMRAFVRQRVSGSAGTSSRLVAFGSAQTECITSGLGSSISCSTQPAPTLVIPGQPATAAGVATDLMVTVYDCKDGTKAEYFNGKRHKSWRKTAYYDRCSTIQNLPTLKMDL